MGDNPKTHFVINIGLRYAPVGTEHVSTGRMASHLADLCGRFPFISQGMDYILTEGSSRTGQSALILFIQKSNLFI